MRTYEFQVEKPGEFAASDVFTASVDAHSLADAAGWVRATYPEADYFLLGSIDREPQVALAFG